MAAVVDFTGRVYGRLTVLSLAERDHRRRAHWLCRCECGNEKVVDTGNLTSGRTTSCGCRRNEESSKRRLSDLAGQKFGALLVLEMQTNDRGEIRWLCRCECGNETIVITSNLTRGHTKSCGCQGRGIKPNEPSLIYLIVHEEWDAVKIGVAKQGSGRLSIHRKTGWKTLWTINAPGVAALRAERAVIDSWRAAGVPEGVSAEQMPRWGHTETAPLQMVDLEQIRTLTEATLDSSA